MVSPQETLYNSIHHGYGAFFKFNYSNDLNYYMFLDETYSLRLANRIPREVAKNYSSEGYDWDKSVTVKKTDPVNFGFQLFSSEPEQVSHILDLEKYGKTKEIKYERTGVYPIVKSGDWYKMEKGGNPVTFYIQPNCTLKDSEGYIVQMSGTFWYPSGRWLNALPESKKTNDSWIPYINLIIADGFNPNATDA